MGKIECPLITHAAHLAYNYAEHLKHPDEILIQTLYLFHCPQCHDTQQLVVSKLSQGEIHVQTVINGDSCPLTKIKP